MAGPTQNMRKPSLPLDPVTGRVAVKDSNGKITWLHPVDAKEQLERGGVKLANEHEAPPTQVGKPRVDWRGVQIGKLREYAQEAGISFTAKTRDMIEKELTDSGFVPDQETPQ